MRGDNIEILRNTLRHLDDLGVRGHKLHKLYRRVLDLHSAVE
jgi:cation transport regulator ChaC